MNTWRKLTQKKFLSRWFMFPSFIDIHKHVQLSKNGDWKAKTKQKIIKSIHHVIWMTTE